MGTGNGCCDYCGEVYHTAHIVDFKGGHKRYAFCSPECAEQWASVFSDRDLKKLDFVYRRTILPVGS